MFLFFLIKLMLDYFKYEPNLAPFMKNKDKSCPQEYKSML